MSLNINFGNKLLNRNHLIRNIKAPITIQEKEIFDDNGGIQKWKIIELFKFCIYKQLKTRINRKSLVGVKVVHQKPDKVQYECNGYIQDIEE